MSKLLPLAKRDLPKPPPLKKLLGPSFILLGLGLGSGELILWPYLSSKYGLGIIWGALLGITFQFFLNMEIERYTLITGESVFVGMRKLKKISPFWFIFSTLLPWMWPGIIASSALLFSEIMGIKYQSIIPIIFLLLIGLALTLGPIIYKTQEIFQRTLILIGVPVIFILVLIFAKPADWSSLFSGLIGRGEGYLYLPAGISLASFLGAFAYAGAGGNLNLAQSYYIKEKGYGMGKYSGRITSILTGKKEKIVLEGNTFPENEKNMKRFKLWWKRINLEHFIVFWITGTLSMLSLSLLSYSTLKNKILPEGIGFIISEAKVISSSTIPILGSIFLIIAALMLFSTQFSVLDATSRIMSENLIILSKKIRIEKLPQYYYLFLWLQILSGITIFLLGINEPLQLVIIGASLNAITMFVYSGLILWLNLTKISKNLRPSMLRVFVILCAFLFYGGFSLITILQNI